MTEYTVDSFKGLPSDQYKYNFVFRPEDSEPHPYENFMSVIYDWCLENFRYGGWYVAGNEVWLNDDNMAMAFKLRWC